MKKFLPAVYILLALFIVPVCLKLIPYKELEEFKQQEYSVAWYDSDGILLQVSPLSVGGRKEFTPVKQLPKDVKKAIIQAEDKRFYFHHGVDYAAILSAFFQNKAAGQTVRGGSTITMQLAKMLSSDNSQTLSRKLKNALNAYRLEAKLSKNKILELYINNIYFGNGAYGITSAARTYFGKEISQLSKEESCLLAVIPRNPTFYNPIKNPENCINRAAGLYRVLFRKKELKLSAPSLEQITSLIKDSCPSKTFDYPFEAPHLIRYLNSGLQNKGQTSSEKSASGQSAYGQKAGGSKKTANPYKITLSLNLQLQNRAKRYLNQAMVEAADCRITNGALLLLDNKTGSVLAWIGNDNFFDQKNSGQVDGVLVRNQPGSSMKPFLYALALESKDEAGNPLVYPNSVLADVPAEFGNEKLYIPYNFNNRFNGPVKLRIALASSLNVPAVSILNMVGVDNYLDKLFSLGFDFLRFDGKEADLGLALGAGKVSLKELVPAFSVFARDGVYKEINFGEQYKTVSGKEKFTDSGNTTSHDNNAGTNNSAANDSAANTTTASYSAASDSPENTSSTRRIYSADTARIIDSFLSDKSARALGFGYTQSFQTEYPSIFKTGTSNQYQDIVALGATKEYTVGVWMGNFNGQTVIGKTGSSLPATVARELLDYLENGKAQSRELKFDEPENYVKVKVCSLSGMPAGAACPSFVYEYIPLNKTSETGLSDSNLKQLNQSPAIQQLSPCTWHSFNSSRETVTTLPAEYQSWIRQNNISYELDYGTMDLTIQTPKDNSIFYYSLANKNRQAIPVEVLGGKEDILYAEYDGKMLPEQKRPFYFNLPVSIGNHSLTVYCGNESRTISFQVK